MHKNRHFQNISLQYIIQNALLRLQALMHIKQDKAPLISKSETSEEIWELFSSNLLLHYKTLMSEVTVAVCHNYV
jgi:hypothetical protein